MTPAELLGSAGGMSFACAVAFAAGVAHGLSGFGFPLISTPTMALVSEVRANRQRSVELLQRVLEAVALLLVLVLEDDAPDHRQDAEDEDRDPKPVLSPTHVLRSGHCGCSQSRARRE